ncbi:hypothetical protein SCBWM1_gp108 [Synechococcus phage S-CBWM1]|uniref:Uncharacterized protein n=1 Tax=Synechococcus phage S-CBWM1 TaxID=2053653 RepID=A0A3G1L3M9_9CAUD|nr:hypothetical protein HOU61_gp089 [Synechococcus phage S-CBWM1]ATW62792.1 hypothetical protein SCBWM1_gp108 [Synechococcus phage S-CBWM1]
MNSYFDPQVENQIREAIAESMKTTSTPEDQDTLKDGTPTSIISNTTPWMDSIGLWKGNTGNDPNFKPKQPIEPLVEEEEEEEEEVAEEEEKSLSEDEIDALIRALEEEEESEEDVLNDEELLSIMEGINEDG